MKLSEYRCNAIMLKSIYTNTSSVFSNGTMADNPALSSLVCIHFIIVRIDLRLLLLRALWHIKPLQVQIILLVV
jgi:hypothetical protein